MLNTSKLNQNQIGILYAFATAFIWGFLALKLKLALLFIDSLSLVWARFSVAFFLLVIWKFHTKEKTNLNIKPLSYMIICALGLGVNYLGYLRGVELAGPVTAQIIIQTGPLLLAIMGVVVFKEKIRKKQLLGLIFLIPGFYLFYSGKISQLGSSLIYNQGSLWVLLGAISWTIYAVFQKILVRNYSTGQINLFIFSLCSLLYMPFVNFVKFATLPWYAWALVLLLGLNTLLAYTFVGEALKRIEAYKVGVIITLNPFITVLVVLILESLNFTYFGPENLSIKLLLGILFFISGAIIFIYFGGQSKGLPIEDQAHKKS